MVEYRFIAPREAYQLIKGQKALLLDVRRDFERSMRTVDVEQFFALEAEKIAEKYSALPQDKLILIIDSVGLKSKNVYEYLKGQGFINIAIIIGGVVEWEKDGLPICKNPDFNYGGQCLCQVKPRPKKNS